MSLTMIFNLILAIGVTIMVVAPLLWAIHAERGHTVRTAGTSGRALRLHESRARQHTRREALHGAATRRATVAHGGPVA